MQYLKVLAIFTKYSNEKSPEILGRFFLQKMSKTIFQRIFANFTFALSTLKRCSRLVDNHVEKIAVVLLAKKILKIFQNNAIKVHICLLFIWKDKKQCPPLSSHLLCNIANPSIFLQWTLPMRFQ